MIKIIIGAIVVAAIVIGGFMLIDPNLKNNQIETVEVDNTFSYSIEGEVARPGTYKLDEDITFNDLINAAGGLTTNADELMFFPDAKLVSGSTYYVGGKYDASDVCSNSEIKKVNINVDNADKLTAINGITSSIASSIVSYRSEQGTFNFVEDLLNVYGVGNATYRKIRNYVILHE